MSDYCGLDFGTSNSTLGVSLNGKLQLVNLEENKPSIRSAIYCDSDEKAWVFGQRGIENYLNGSPGRLLMSIKSILGSSLMDDETLILNELVSYKKILAKFLFYIKGVAEAHIGKSLTHVVMGRPVRFDDNDIKKDKMAEKTLQSIAYDIGFKEVCFQYEPIAAAIAYERTITKEKLALIVDMGGGTSDFTIIRLSPQTIATERKQDVLSNCGIHIAGTNFDQKLSLDNAMPFLGMGSLMKGSSCDIEVPSMYYHNLTTWHTLNDLYKKTTLAHIKSLITRAYDKESMQRLLTVLRIKAGHRIMVEIESGKHRLSYENKTHLDFSFIEHACRILIEQASFNTSIDELLSRIIATINKTVALARVTFIAIEAIFFTGGSTQIPIIRNKIIELFPNAEIIRGDVFGSVGLGLTIEAERRFS
jgi:hypothetical chaperone protein